MPRTTSHSETEKPSKRRRWIRRGVILLAALGVLAWAINGPIFRGVARWGIEKGLTASELEGSYELEGTLAGGVRLKDADLEGTGQMRGVSIERAELDFSLLPALKGNFIEVPQRLKVQNAEIRVGGSGKEKPEEEEEEEVKERSQFDASLFELTNAEVDVENLDFILEGDDKDSEQLAVRDINIKSLPDRKGADLKLDAAEITGTFEGLTLKGGLDGEFRLENEKMTQGKASIDASLTENGKDISLSARANVGAPNQIEILSDLASSFGTNGKVSARLNLNEKTYDGDTAIHAEQLSELGPFLEAFGIDLELAGSADLAWNGTGDFSAAPDAHSGEISIDAQDVSLGGGRELSGEIEGDYASGRLAISNLALSMDDYRLSGTGELSPGRVELKDLRLVSQEVELARADVSIPLGGEAGFWEQTEPVNLRLDTRKLDLAEISRMFSLEPALEGELSANVSASGPPSDLTAEGTVEWFDGAVGETALNEFDLVMDLNIADDRLKMDGQLDREDFAGAEISGSMAFQPQKWSEDPDALLAETIEARITVQDTKLGSLASDVPAFADTEGDFSLDLKVGGTLGQPELSGTIHAQAPSVKLPSEKAPELENVELKLRLDQNRLVVETGAFSIGPDRFNLDGDVDLGNPKEPKVEVSLTSPHLKADAELTQRDGDWIDGELMLNIEGLDYAGIQVSELELDVSVPETNVFAIEVDGKVTPGNSLRGSGRVSLEDESYSGNLNADFANLGELAWLWEIFPQVPPLSGGVDLTWEGDGNFGVEHTGQAEVTASNLSISGGTAIDGSVTGTYSPEVVDIPAFTLRARDLTATGQGEFRDKTIRVSDLKLKSGDKLLASVEAEVPFDPAKSFWEQSEPLDVDLETNDLSFETLLELVKADPDVGGTLTSSLEISGPPGALLADGFVRVDDLSTGKADFEPFQVNLDVELQDGQLVLDGEALQENLTPVSLSGRIGFRPREWSEDPGAVMKEPIEARVEVERTQLSALREFLPQVSRMEGWVSVDLEAAGTLAEPNLEGRLQVEAPLIRFARQELPTLTRIGIDLNFADDRVTFTEFEGEIAGGPFEVNGQVNLATLTAPEFDLRLVTEETLIARDGSLNLRANSDITLKGPWEAASIAGEVSLTSGRYYRDIEILPIGMLTSGQLSTTRAGKAPLLDVKDPKPPGLHVAPFEDWTLDVRVNTDEPFRVRGNLANADIVADLQLTGTLGNPVPDGTVKVEKGIAELPFSELTVRTATATFTPQTGLLNPRLDARVISNVNEYRITIYVFGTAQNPEYILSSQPPLVETEIVSLLATGSVPGDLSGTRVLASKAALLVVRDVLQRAKKLVLPGQSVDDDEDSVVDVFQEKVDLDLNAVNLEEGQFEAGTTIKLTDNVRLIGAVDETGNSRGVLKFLIRLK